MRGAKDEYFCYQSKGHDSLAYLLSQYHNSPYACVDDPIVFKSVPEIRVLIDPLFLSCGLKLKLLAQSFKMIFLFVLQLYFDGFAYW